MPGRFNSLWWFCLLTISFVAGGCHRAPDSKPSSGYNFVEHPTNRNAGIRSRASEHNLRSILPLAPDTGKGPIVLTDITDKAHIHFMHRNGGSGRHYFVESMSGGCAFFDYDGDGWEDVFLVQSAPMPNYSGPQDFHPALYHNNHDGTFTNVTAESGLDITMYGMGAAVGDYDNDGRPDLIVTAFGGNHLFHNEGNGKFRDVTKRAGIAGSGLPSSAAWVDYDHDGFVDLIVCRYCDYSLATDPLCRFEGSPVFCPPARIKPAHSLLYHNNGDGTFTDVTTKSGLARYAGRSLGVVAVDLNGDSWDDFYLANDQSGNQLFINNKNGTFREVAQAAGARDNESFAGMGVDCGDYRNDGNESLVVTNFRMQPVSLFTGLGRGVFSRDVTTPAINLDNKLFVKWGIRFVDLDLDGYQDLFFVCGDTDDSFPLVPAGDSVSYPEPAFVLHNEKGRFVNLGTKAGTFFSRIQVARGAAFGDYDNDGKTDVLVACNNQPAILLHNDSPTKNHWIRVQMEGSARPGHKGCNRDGLGTRVRVVANGMTQTQFLRSGTSYLADHDRRMLFGIGQDAAATVEVRWPCGSVQKASVRAGQSITIHETGCKIG